MKLFVKLLKIILRRKKKTDIDRKKMLQQFERLKRLDRDERNSL